MTTPLAEQLFQVQTSDDVETIITSLPDIGWEPLGGRPLNFPTVNIGADPGDALVERITNGMDALIEREVARQAALELDSPRQAVAKLFGIPHGRLAYLKDTRERRELAQRLKVTLRDSGAKKRPTVVVEDQGIGQHPDAFPTTLLSLNQSNKVNRHELMGAFGQGGAAAFAFAEYTIFVARRDPALLELGQDDAIGWTVVRFNPLNENYKYGVYEYLVVPDDQGDYHIPRFDPAELPGDYRDFVGCYFAGVEYQLERYSAEVFRPNGSLWQLLNFVLFDPIYPILIRDERSQALRANEKSAKEGVVVSGNATRLDEDKRSNIEYSNTYAIPLGEDGSAIVRYVVLRDKGDPKANWELMRSYIPNEIGVTITLNGQRQGTMRRDIFNKLGLMSIGKEIIVQVDCDGLSKRAKWQLFSATRDRIKDSEVASRLEREIRVAIAGDQSLRELDRERKQRALARQSETEAKKINDWLKDAIKSLKKGIQQVFRRVVSTNPDYPLLGDQPLLDEGADHQPPKPATPKAVQLTDPPEEPTTIRVINPIVRVPEGGKAVVRLAMDAPDDYVTPEPGLGKGAFAARFTKNPDLFEMTGFSALRDGVLRATVKVKKGVPLGERGKAIFAVTRANAFPLLAEAEVVVVEAPQPRAKPVGSKAGPEMGPEVKAIDREGWLELGWSEHIVAQVEENPTENTTTIWVYKEHPKLMSRLRKERVTEENLVQYQSKYVAAMGLAAWLQYEQEKEREDKLDEEARNAELSRTADVFLFTQFVAKDSPLADAIS